MEAFCCTLQIRLKDLCQQGLKRHPFPIRPTEVKEPLGPVRPIQPTVLGGLAGSIRLGGPAGPANP